MRHQAARALGKAGLDAKTEAQLAERLGDPKLGGVVLLALLPGGSADSAKRAIEEHPKPGDVAELYAQSFSSVSREDVPSGRLFRWIRNSRAAGDAWPREIIKRELANVMFDSGPHSLTRVMLRRSLFEKAQSGSPDERAGARAALELLGERGAIDALD